jgi:hypothetical protein
MHETGVAFRMNEALSHSVPRCVVGTGNGSPFHSFVCSVLSVVEL